MTCGHLSQVDQESKRRTQQNDKESLMAMATNQNTEQTEPPKMYHHNMNQETEVKEAQVNETEASLEAMYREEASQESARQVLEYVDLNEIVELLETERKQAESGEDQH